MDRAIASALRAGYTILEGGGTSLDAITAAIIVLEDLPYFNARKGAVFSHDGINAGQGVASDRRVSRLVLFAKAVLRPYSLLEMKTMLVTGATSGIGLEAAVALARSGHRLVLVGRDLQKAEGAVAQVKQRSGAAEVFALGCDFGSQAQIRRLAAEYRARYDRLDVLLNNAGLVTARRTVTEDGIETTFAVNHLGSFLLTTLLLDLVVKSAPARIVNVSSTNHYRGTMDLDDLGFEKGGWSVMGAYSRSKLGNVLFTRALAKRLEGRSVTVNAVHPGGVDTGIWKKAPWFAQPVLFVFRKLMLVSAEEGAKRLLYLVTSPEVEGKTGLYFEDDRAKQPSPLALDDALAEQLWAESDRLTRSGR
jgi:retinol dehydrogenase 14